MSQIVPRALTIAGSDSGGGAGIQADLKTFTALRVFGMSAITSVTAQNTTSVLGIMNLSPDFIELQIDAVLKDIGVDAVKIGMLSTKEIINSVAGKINEYGLKNIVLDPVMVAKGGESLLNPDAEETIIQELLPHATVLTPNIPEAEVISGLKISSVEDMKTAAQKIRTFGPENVLLKGGHLDKSTDAVDILYDGTDFFEFKTPRVDTKNTHGTGCTYSAAICAGLAKGFSILEAVKEAKNYVTFAIENSFDIGKGHGPLNHFWKID
ncbi:MAG: bifunctional hydroxymethylpyrimidine kinase/phosphomethylpyrimidine kinase [Thermodesulfobacteriota bacterium]